MIKRQYQVGRTQPMGKFRSFVKKTPEFGTHSSTGRYYPGQVLYGIAFSYAGRNMSTTAAPLLWDDQQPSQIHLNKLTVTEHRKVPLDYDDKRELKYDGYKLVDDKGRVFLNQFPQASYGQVSDSGDRRFDEHVAEGDWKKRLDTDAEDPASFTLVTEMFGTIVKGEEDLQKIINEHQAKRDSSYIFDERVSRAHRKLEQLRILKKKIKEKFAETFEGKVIYGKKIRRWGWWEGKIADNQEEAWKDQYSPVSINRDLVTLVKKCAKYKVKPGARIRDGYYYRLHLDMITPAFDYSMEKIGGFYPNNKKSEVMSKGACYRAAVCGILNIDRDAPHHYTYGDGLTRSASLYEMNAATKALCRALQREDAFVFYVLIDGGEDSPESYAKFMKDHIDAKEFDEATQNTWRDEWLGSCDDLDDYRDC